MKLIVTILTITICSCLHSYAQPRHMMKDHGMERIHAIKVAYITDKLHFTPEQSASFWPIYNQYEKEIRDIRHAYIDKYLQDNPATDDRTARQQIDANLDYQQEVLNIKRKYNDEFLKVITPQQVAELYKAEREFKQMLIRRLNQRGMGPRGMGNGQWEHSSSSGDDIYNDK